MKKKQAFSLIEVLVFTTILGFVFISITTIVTFSLKNLKTQEHKILATHYAEELLNWLKAKKEEDWLQFTAKSGNTYCFNSSPITNWPSASFCSSYNLNSIFKREVALSGNFNQINADISVKWQEGNGENQVNIKTIFNPWED